MSILFVRSNALGSRFICWLLNEPCSHIAFAFDDLGLVFHSYLWGAEVQWLAKFLLSHTVVHELPGNMTIKQMVTNYAGQGYDYKAFLYWGWRLALKKWFGIPLPKVNAWAQPKYNLCTALIGDKLIGQDPEMISPEALYERLTSAPSR